MKKRVPSLCVITMMVITGVFAFASPTLLADDPEPGDPELEEDDEIPCIQHNGPWYTCVFEPITFEAWINNFEPSPYTWTWTFYHYSGCGEDFEIVEQTSIPQHEIEDLTFDCVCEYIVVVKVMNGEGQTACYSITMGPNLHVTPCNPDVNVNQIYPTTPPIRMGSSESFAADLYNAEEYAVYVDVRWLFDWQEFEYQEDVYVPSRDETPTPDAQKDHWPYNLWYYPITAQIWYFGNKLHERTDWFRARIL